MSARSNLWWSWEEKKFLVVRAFSRKALKEKIRKLDAIHSARVVVPERSAPTSEIECPHQPIAQSSALLL